MDLNKNNMKKIKSATTYRLFNTHEQKYLSGTKSKNTWMQPAAALSMASYLGANEIHLFNMESGNKKFTLREFQVYDILQGKASRAQAERSYKKWRIKLAQEISDKFEDIVGVPINNPYSVSSFINKNQTSDHKIELSDVVVPLVRVYNNTDFEKWVLDVM